MQSQGSTEEIFEYDKEKFGQYKIYWFSLNFTKGYSWNAYTKKCNVDRFGNGGDDDCYETRRYFPLSGDLYVPW